MTAQHSSTRSQRWRWPVLLAFVLLGQAGGVIAMVVISGRDASFAIEPDYYERALAWDETSRLKAASDALGWTAEPILRSTARDQTLEISLRDSLHRPLDGAAVQVELYHHARAADRETVQLSPRGDGVYGASVAMPRAGLWELRIRADRGPDTLLTSQDLRVEGSVP
jgi:nitrogen fixation protein FixH